MESERKIKSIYKQQPTIEGAGVKLNRVFGFNNEKIFDPFLLMDCFKSDKESDYIKGFPWHPHRGIETITYILEGEVEHMDSLGNKGIIKSGDVQWMTAGSGIIHQEMPRGDADKRMWGFQLWANLPAADKMMPPRYREILSNEIPEFVSDKLRVKIIAGEFGGKVGAVRDIKIQPQFFDVKIAFNTPFIIETASNHRVLIYVIDGNLAVDDRIVSAGSIAVFDDGDFLKMMTENEPARFLFLSGKPLNEPIAWYGPIVMNTHEELVTAFEEFNNGTFLKK